MGPGALCFSDLVIFIKKVHNLPPNKKPPKAKVLRFAPVGITESGVAQLLQSAQAPAPSSDADLARAATKLSELTTTHGSIDAIPLRDVIRLYLDLLVFCINVETIQIPAQWDTDFEIPEGYFPLVDRESKVEIEEDEIVYWGLQIYSSDSDWDEEDEEGKAKGKEIDENAAAMVDDRGTFFE
ncbi:hypothetical protein K458DRAFT_487123 [Lentithecium fluviatile CBS 122367]|uniref:Uncharacterized protein n=1 Tax=Lentithecium fluviatile CBS 122367 TaxID=1168545 RepID=A0A6G1J2U3_9PLEO|nr:hypothetical protein K458DRAFT_487123 [Lentithecium fluviatile CBS 122367]